MLVSAIQGLYGQQMSYLQLDRIPLQADASTISCILQDQSGLIWMGSNAGLLSYDGYTIQSHFEYGKNSNYVFIAVLLQETLSFLEQTTDY